MDDPLDGDDFNELVALIRGGAAAQREKADRDMIDACDRFLRDRLEPMYAPAITAKLKSGTRTRTIYKSTFRGFVDYCAYLGVPPLPAKAGIIAGYLDELLVEKGADVARLRREVAAIGFAHRAMDLDDPTSDPLIAAMVRTASNSSKGGANGTTTH
jgi:hypothetical protein